MILINMEKPSLISKDSLVPLGLVFTLVAAAVSFGVMYQKVEEVRGDVQDMKTQVTKLDDKMDALLSQRSLANQ